MTNQEAIDVLKNDIEICTFQQEQACDMAIKALEDIDKIKSIIRTHENLLELDVMRYKMICEVIANDE